MGLEPRARLRGRMAHWWQGAALLLGPVLRKVICYPRALDEDVPRVTGSFLPLGRAAWVQGLEAPVSSARCCGSPWVIMWLCLH